MDKANSNVVLICKQFYLEVLLKALGVSKNEQVKCTDICNFYDFVDQQIIN